MKGSFKEAFMSSPGPRNVRETLDLFFKAFLMGIADLIPGVSGGTIAFITGIYEDLLNCIASIDHHVLKDLLKLDFKAALSKVHIRFLLPLVFGILFAIFSLARLMHYLMNEHTVLTWSAFFGLIGASIVVIFKKLEEPKRPANIISLICGALFAYIMVSLIPVQTPREWWFIVLCGMIGITAMILPGLSGSFLLLILGKYEYITGAVKNPFVAQNFVTLLTFATGTALGLILFSRLLKYFLDHHHSTTMAFLTGILIGSMKKVWPWKEVLETVVVRGKTRILREANILPDTLNQEVLMSVFLIIVGFFLVLHLEKKATFKETSKAL